MISFLLFDHAVSFTLLSRLDPFIVMLLSFFPAYMYFNIRIEYCGVIAAVFFAGILRKNTKFVPSRYRQAWILSIPLIWYITANVSPWIGLFVQLIVDYIVYPQVIYLHKTWNRLVLFVLLVFFSNNEAVILSISVAHGILLHFLYS